MVAGLLAALDRVPVWARRWLVIGSPLLLIGVLVAGFALAPTGPGRHPGRATTSERLLPPASTGGVSARAGPVGAIPQASESTLSTGSQEGETIAPRPLVRLTGGERERPPSPRSSLGMMLAVAQRFSVAYMPYQIGRLPGWARRAIERTCTPGFARYLLAHPAQLTPLLAGHPKDVETYRVASVNLAAGANTVAVSYVSEQDSADTSAFLLSLTNQDGRWLVDRLEA